MAERDAELRDADAASVVKYERPVEREFPQPWRHSFKERQRRIGEKKCKHPQCEVDVDARRVFCQTCGVELDPIQCIIDIARYDKLIDQRLEVIRAYEAEKRRRAEFDRESDRESAIRRLRELAEGTGIWLEYLHGICSGEFVKIDGDDVVMRWADESDTFRVPLADVTKMRKTKVRREDRTDV